MVEHHEPVPQGRDRQILDVRSVAPRDRHQQIFDGLDALGPGETLRLVNDHDPLPLRYQLDAEYPEHYRWVKLESGPEAWVVDIISLVRIVDARPLLDAGEEPFESIMTAAAATGAGETLVVYAPFEPLPLEAALAERGFSHVADHMEDGTWRIRFKRLG